MWKTFLDRFGKHINVHEFYGATEGNFASISFDNHIGSIGYFSPFSKVGTDLLYEYDIDIGLVIHIQLVEGVR